MLFKVKSKASGEVLKVYAVNNPLKDYQTTRFLVFREEPSRVNQEDGEFVWVDSHFYKPVE